MKGNNFEKLGEEILKEVNEIKIKRDYSKLGLTFNPFPPAGIPRYPTLPPLNSDDLEILKSFIKSTYSYYDNEEFINYSGLAIIGSYGMGKTHLMEYTKAFIEWLNKEDNFSATTCFVDRPEDSPQKVIHHIVDQIGLDTIRKYIWMILIDDFKKDTMFYSKFKSKGTLTSYIATDSDVTKKWDELFEEPTMSNYLQFTNQFEKLGGNLQLLQEESKTIIKNRIITDDILVDRYLSLILPEKKTDKSWEILAGYISSKDIQRKEVKFLNSIVKILRENGFNLLYVFIDEFEDIGKIKGVKLTNYLTTLNTLINNERRWGVIISITEEILRVIQQEAPPLYDRLTTYAIRLGPLDESKAKQLIENYTSLAKDDDEDSISPFSNELVHEILNTSKGNYRSFVRLSHKAIEYAVQNDLNPPLDVDVIEKIKEVAYE